MLHSEWEMPGLAAEGIEGIEDSPSINSQVGSCDIAAGIAEQINDGTLQIFRRTHFADRNERSPFLVEFRVVVQNLTRPVRNMSIHLISCAHD